MINLSFEEKVDSIKNSIKNKFINDERKNWIIGFSGGKDSTALVEMVLEAVSELPEKDRNYKKIHIFSSNTLIENPVVVSKIIKSIESFKIFAKNNKIDAYIKIVSPDINESFWVNLIGRGYPAPNQSFRWCTDRLKIKPMDNFIKNDLNYRKEDCLTLLGVRKDESNSRNKIIEKNATSENDILKNSLNVDSKIFAPIIAFTTADVWRFLLTRNNIFKDNNNQLMILYEDSSGANECPSVLNDENMKKCGSSRWGCWVCPLVKEDKSLSGFVKNGYENLDKLVEFRKWLINGRDDKRLRYNGSFVINKKKNTIGIRPIKLMRLVYKEKNGAKELIVPKKGERDKMIFSLSSKDGKEYIILANSKYDEKEVKHINFLHDSIPIITKEAYTYSIETHQFNPYNNYCFPLIFIKHNKKYYTCGLGSYTLEYRKIILKEIMDLKQQYKTNEEIANVIISDEEITMIEQIHSALQARLDEFNLTKGINNKTDLGISKKGGTVNEQ